MPLLSKLRPLSTLIKSSQQLNALRQMSDHRVFEIRPSRWQWIKFKDLAHFYVMLGVIPCTIFVGCMNLFVGPATLSEIPEGYTPEYWEYYKNPVTRFLARYGFRNPQQDYEKFCTYVWAEQEKIKLRQLEKKILEKMAERTDYQAYYFRPITAAKYFREVREGSEKIIDLENPLSNEQ